VVKHGLSKQAGGVISRLRSREPEFQWYFRYPGVTEISVEQYARESRQAVRSNTWAVIPGILAGRDDLRQRSMVVPLGHTVQLHLRHKMLSQFFIPASVLQQDTRSRNGNQLHLAHKNGNYEIACAELCGLGHYRMRAR